MMLIAKERRNIEKTQRKERIGCWYRRRSAWPKATQYNVEASNNVHVEEFGMDELYLPLATGIANYYGGEFSRRIQMLALALFTDVYRNPAAALEMVLRNPNCARDYSADLFELMAVIGNYNIFFDNGHVGEETIEASEEIAEGLYLTKKRTGMPVKAFLLYLKGEGLRREDIAAMSGIPAKYVKWTYNIITTYMWEMLDGVHQRKAEAERAQRRRPQRRPLESDFKLLVDFSKSPRRMTGEMLETPAADPMDISVDELHTALDEVIDEASSTVEADEKAPWDGLTPGFDQVPFNPEDTEETSE